MLGCADRNRQDGRLRSAHLAAAQPGRVPRQWARTEIRTLVLAPTRELALQICESFQAYGRYTAVRQAAIYGGVDQSPQVRALNQGIDVLIATPGRLLDLMQQGYVDLSHVEVLILDEADRMLDMGFIHDLRRIVAEGPAAGGKRCCSPPRCRRPSARWPTSG